MEERRTNKSGQGLGLSVRRFFLVLFWHSVHLWLSRACTWTKFPHSYQERWLILSRWLTWLLGPQVLASVTASLRASWMSLTPLCWLLWDLAFPRLFPVSLEISRVSPLSGFHAKTDKGILWLALTHAHTHTHRTNAHHRATKCIKLQGLHPFLNLKFKSKRVRNLYNELMISGGVSGNFRYVLYDCSDTFW